MLAKIELITQSKKKKVHNNLAFTCAIYRSCGLSVFMGRKAVHKGFMYIRASFSVPRTKRSQCCLKIIMLLRPSIKKPEFSLLTNLICLCRKRCSAQKQSLSMQERQRLLCLAVFQCAKERENAYQSVLSIGKMHPF